MLHVPYSKFVEYVCSPSHERFGVIRQFLSWGDYEPEKDFYLLLNNAIRRSALSNKPLLVEDVLAKTKHQTKLEHYPTLIENFEKWRSKKKCTFFSPPHAVWKSSLISIPLKPLLGFEVDGVRYLAFFHCRKSIEIKKNAADFLLHIPAEAYAAKHLMGYRYCMIDLRVPKTWTLGNIKPGVSQQLHWEADNFARMYQTIDSAA
jgi:hypothetical protein